MKVFKTLWCLCWGFGMTLLLCFVIVNVPDNLVLKDYLIMAFILAFAILSFAEALHYERV